MNAPASGPPHRGGEGRPRRGIPRSRAFWELKAEQMMNRIFDPDDPIDLPFETRSEEELASGAPIAQHLDAGGVAAPSLQDAQLDQLEMPAPAAAATADGVAIASVPLAAPAAVPLAGPADSDSGRQATGGSAAAPATGTAAREPGVAPIRPRSPSRRGNSRPDRLRSPSRRPDDRLLLVSALAGVCMVSVAGSLLYFGYWNRLQQSLTQERNLLLVERLRSLGPAGSAPAPAPAPEPLSPTLPAPASATAPTAEPGTEGLPPPPPEEPWIEQLSSLPGQAGTAPRVLTVPLQSRLAGASLPPSARPIRPPAPAAAPPSRPTAPLPQLVGVVGGPGNRSSAIFLLGGQSLSVSSGEVIGSSGWRLRSAEGETALIERDGEVRQISIVSGNGF